MESDSLDSAEPRDIDSQILDSNSKVPKLVVDSGAFIKLVQLQNIGEEIYTLPEVIEEIKDSKTKHYLETFRDIWGLKIKSPHPDTLKIVIDFAQKTGDYASLSGTDLKLIALVYTIERETNGNDDHLRKQPVIEKPKIVEKPPGIGFFDIKNNIPEEKITDKQKNPWGVGNFGDSAEGGWITPDNVSEYTEAFKALEGKEKLEEKHQIKVACLTTDFAMQNVLLQMNMNIITVDKLVIKSAQKWILRCYGCFKLCKDNTKLFCPNCGHPTLAKVSYKVSQDGTVIYNLPRYKPSPRGTRYPIPTPKGGRQNKDLILSASDLPRGNKKKDKLDLDDPDRLFLEGRRFQNKRQPVVGYGKQNPNTARKNFGKKNKSKRRL